MIRHSSLVTRHGLPKAPFVIALVMLAALGCSRLPKEVLEEFASPAGDFVMGPEDVLEVCNV